MRAEIVQENRNYLYASSRRFLENYKKCSLFFNDLVCFNKNKIKNNTKEVKNYCSTLDYSGKLLLKTTQIAPWCNHKILSTG